MSHPNLTRRQRAWGWVRVFVLLALGFGVKAQAIGTFNWQVTHDKKLAATLTGLEATRATLEANIAAQKAAQVVIGNFHVSTESYHALRAYAKTLRLLRMTRQIKRAYANMDFRGREWALLPQLKMIAPTEIGTDPDGNPIMEEREMFSLSLVPPELQASWDMTKYPDDDILAPLDKAKHLINFDYPHKLSDLQFTWTPSPFLEQSTDAESGMYQLMAHSYEALLTAAARTAGYGVRVNPQVLASGAVLLEGRASPAQMKLQAEVYQQRALEILDQVVRIYIDHGMSINNADKRIAFDREYWQGYADKVVSGQSARIAFSMNLMKEINQTIARLEAFERVNKDAETDDLLKNLGKKRKTDGTYEAMTEGGDLWDSIDKILGYNPNGDAIKLQAKGISARYAHSQFEEVQGWRNIMAGLMRADIAMEGVEQVQASAREANDLTIQAGQADYSEVERFNGLVKSSRTTTQALKNMGWGTGNY